jgi:hypothetical protein
MEIQPYTDFVIRLNERHQDQLLASIAPAEQSQPATPSRRERREEKRALLRAGRGWGMTAPEAAQALRQQLWGIPFVLGGVALAIAFALFADWIVYRLLAGILAVLGIWAVSEWAMGALRLTQAWSRARRPPGQEQTVDGIITGFTPVNPAADEDKQRAIIWLTRADGAPTPTYLVLGPRLLDDALLAGQRVRIHYLPPNDVVVAVQPIAESKGERTSDVRSS